MGIGSTQIVPFNNTHKKSTPKKRRRRRKTARKGNAANLSKTYRLSKPLSALLNVEYCTRQDVMKRIWALAKSRNLQDGQTVNADAAFFDCFGQHAIHFREMPGLINRHLIPEPTRLTQEKVETPTSSTDESETDSETESTPTPTTLALTPPNDDPNMSTPPWNMIDWVRSRTTDQLAAWRRFIDAELATRFSHGQIMDTGLKKENPTN